MKTHSKEQYVELIQTTPDYHRPTEDAPKYSVGDTVLTDNINPLGHTRFPRYARGKKGTVLQNYGACVVPDLMVASGDETPEYVYLVRFTAEELWGRGAGNFNVNLSMFDSYIASKC